MNKPAKPHIAVRRDIVTAAPPAGCGRCQVCGAIVGAGITHCLRCRAAHPRATVAPPRAHGAGLLWLVLLVLVGFGVWFLLRGRIIENQLAACTAEETSFPSAEETSFPSAAPHPPVTAQAQTQQMPARAASPHTPNAVRQEPPPPRSAARLVRQTAHCRACGGTGRYRSGGANRTCPICRGTPLKMRWISPTHTLCAKCSGFGRVLEVRHGVRRVVDCSNCRGCGMTKK